MKRSRGRHGRWALLSLGLAHACSADANSNASLRPSESDGVDASSSEPGGPDASTAAVAPANDASSQNDASPQNDAQSDALAPTEVSAECRACVETDCSGELSACNCDDLIECSLQSGCLGLETEGEILSCLLGNCGRLLPADAFEGGLERIGTLRECIEAQCLLPCLQ